MKNNRSAAPAHAAAYFCQEGDDDFSYFNWA